MNRFSNEFSDGFSNKAFSRALLKTEIPELLSPAGSFAALTAAVENGCDAVYLGGKQFSARNSAENFDCEGLVSAIDYCHMRDVKVFITVNTLYKNSELSSLLSFIDKMCRSGADAFILQDIGAASLINSNFPGVPLHASTQTGVADRLGAEFLAEMGFSRLNLARELSLPEIRTISQSNIETEVFVHGALCVCYSGQCRLSGIIGGRSGNRGRCAQPCRLTYELLKDLPQTSSPISSFVPSLIPSLIRKGYLLSPRDIMTLEILPEIIKTGVSSLKIEGRMKSPEYVALATKMYRDALDAIKGGLQNEGEFSIADLTQIFNRGGSFSSGYFKSFAGLDMMSPFTPKSAGLRVGVVESYKGGKCIISLETELLPGDGIEIWTREEPHVGTNINKNYPANGKAVINISGDIHPGDPVYRSFDKGLDRRLKKLCEPDTRKIRVGFSLRAKIGESAKLTLTRGNTSVTVDSGTIICPAQSSPVTREKLLQQITKTGGTTLLLVPENIGADGDVNIDENADKGIDIDDNIFLNIGAINALRREAIERFTEEYLKNTRRIGGEILEMSEITESGCSVKQERITQKIFVLVQTSDQFKGAISEYVDRIYFEISDDFLEKIQKYKQLAEENNIELFACLPYISRQDGVNSLADKIAYLTKHGVNGFLARTYGQIQMLRKAGAAFVADHTLNTFNSFSKEFWADMSGVTYSTELSLKEIREIDGFLPKRNCEMIIYGHHVLMATHQCPVGNYEAKKKSGKFCGLRNHSENYVLKDRKGMHFPVRTDCENCVALILSGAPIFTLNKISSIKDSRVEGLRLMFDSESREETAEVVYAYGYMIKSENEPENELDNELDERIGRLNEKYAGIASGHFYRGVQ